MILIRCSKCKKFYSEKQNSQCRYCGHKDKTNKAYYVRVSGHFEFAGNSLTLAREIELKRKTERRTGDIPEYKKESILTFSDYIKKYFLPHFEAKNRGKVPHFIFNHFIRCFGDKPLSGIKTADIETAVISGSAGRTIATYKHYVANIKRIFNYALELDLIKSSPVKIKKKVNDNKRYRFLSIDEAERLLAACKKSATPYLHEMVFIALYTGMRLGEIQTLSADDVHDGAIYVQSIHAKSGKGRIIGLPSDVRIFFETASFDYGHDIKKSFAAALRLAGITDFHFHDLRHTYASWLVQEGVDLYQVKKLLGHSTIELTQRYAHLAPGNLTNAVNRLKVIK
jgi:integrase/DNA-directed RNA polymerase subunit RPC12/RpoP